MVLKNVEREAKNSYYVNEVTLVASAESILIIDDVYTSGSTVNEIIRAVREVNNKCKIYVFTISRTAFNEFEAENKYICQNQTLARILDGNSKVKNTISNETSKGTQKKYSASYTGNSSNFSIQQLDYSNVTKNSHEVIIAAKIIKNILQRGNPTIPSRFLRNKLDIKSNQHGQAIRYLPQSNEECSWIIDDCKNAAIRLLINRVLGQISIFDKKLKSLVIPSVPVSDLPYDVSPYYANFLIDVFIPDLFLAIFINDNNSFRNEALINDLESHGLKVIVVSEESLKDKRAELEVINQVLSRYKWLLDNESSQLQKNYLTNYRSIESLNKEDEIKNIALDEIIRLQISLLDSIISGSLDLKNIEEIHVSGVKFRGSAELAVEDLNIWFTHLCILNDYSFDNELLKATEVDYFSGIDTKFNIKFSLCDKYDNRHNSDANIVVCADYFDKRITFHNVEDKIFECEDIDYFCLDSDKPIEYKFLGNQDSYYKSLRFILENVFLPNLADVDFREGQYQIILNALSRNNTIGLLPTGSGKSICYQICALLQPSISFVVCPIKSLMYDQKFDLDLVGINRTAFITSDMTPAEKKIVQKDFSSGKYFFIFISPERFQGKIFRDELKVISETNYFAYAVIDEVHCLSEWGHDFRTSYLNLSNTINKFASGSTYIGLTATASLNVLTDIQNEFDIDDEDVKTPSKFERDELEFDVINDQTDKQRTLLSTLSQFKLSKGNDSGIIFTPHVNGRLGCEQIASYCSNQLNIDVRYYSGSKPRNYGSDSEFEQYKKQVLTDFKFGRFNLLAATKAFGMGVNKGDVSFTIHYGIPQSMESLYQEAGRAGRDKKLFDKNKAKCLVLLGEEQSKANTDEIWDVNSTVDQIKEAKQRLSPHGDLSSNLYMYLQSNRTINEQSKLLTYLYDLVDKSGVDTVIIKTKSVNRNLSLEKEYSGHEVEKAIYKLCQIGVITDWTVESYFSSEYLVHVGNCRVDSIRGKLLETIRKYDPEFSMSKLQLNASRSMKHLLSIRERNGHESEERFYLIFLLLWSYEHFSYNRRQSLKTVYDQCYARASKQITKSQFKASLEGYFKFNKSSTSLKQLAEEPKNITDLFKLLLKKDNQLKSYAALKSLQNQLSRFLESYMDNTALDYLSGLLRLIFDDFEDMDGKRRLESAIRNMNLMPIETQLEMIDQSCNVIKQLDKDHQQSLIKCVNDNVSDLRVVCRFNEKLEKYSSSGVVLVSQLDKISEINKRLNIRNAR